jgi:N-acetylglucosaminyldiphosphoundecaprenol N-acetyl-beta-D-mannosaminyltransferase
MKPQLFNKINILGVEIGELNLDLACQALDLWIKATSKAYVCVAPVSTIVDCQENPEYKAIVNGADMVTPDGMPLVWLGKLKGRKDIERTYGPDLILKFCALSQEKGYKHYFYGSTAETNQMLIVKLREQFSNLNIVGHFAPPFRNVSEKENPFVLEEINRANPDVLWVGLGSPKQDYWMRDHRDKLNVPVMVGVGAAFDFLAGVKKQAPVRMQRCGLEWFFRLWCEPKRLWKRYLVGNTKFIYWILRDFFRKTK